ncbi:MAG TPA: DUF86 domain-containing protein [Rhodospirillaceae bacterium]|nr:DUF86 domain-containing protein [Rhodospirillaceae bacterium]
MVANRSKADPQYEKTFPALPLAEAKRMRNFVIHGYDQVNVTVVWETAKNDIPDLRNKVTNIIAHRQAARNRNEEK